jgi:hypothetical protein
MVRSDVLELVLPAVPFHVRLNTRHVHAPFVRALLTAIVPVGIHETAKQERGITSISYFAAHKAV